MWFFLRLGRRRRPIAPLRSSVVLRTGASTDGGKTGCCCEQLTPLYGLVRRLPQSRGAAATFVARERRSCLALYTQSHVPGPVGNAPWDHKERYTLAGQSMHSYSRLSLDRRSVTFCRACIAPIGSYFGIGCAALERCVTLCLSFLLSGLNNGCAGGIIGRCTIIAFSPDVRAL